MGAYHTYHSYHTYHMGVSGSLPYLPYLPYRSQWKLAILVILTIWDLVHAYRTYHTYHMGFSGCLSYLPYLPYSPYGIKWKLTMTQCMHGWLAWLPGWLAGWRASWLAGLLRAGPLGLGLNDDEKLMLESSRAQKRYKNNGFGGRWL